MVAQMVTFIGGFFVGISTIIALQRKKPKEPAKKHEPVTWSELNSAAYELTCPMTITEAEPIEDVLDYLPKAMADHYRKKRGGLIKIEPGEYMATVQCIANFQKKKGPYR